MLRFSARTQWWIACSIACWMLAGCNDVLGIHPPSGSTLASDAATDFEAIWRPKDAASVREADDDAGVEQ